MPGYDFSKDVKMSALKFYHTWFNPKTREFVV